MLRDRWFFGRKCDTFTLQWHLTQECSFHCRHCYDRSARGTLPLDRALQVLAGLEDFCVGRAIRGQVCLTGGDPLRYPHFWELYASIHRAGFPISLLGNPIAPSQIERLLGTQPPSYYQVSLEGRRDYNDSIRGHGHFAVTLDFLRNARALGLRTHVMLTLSRSNLDEVLPLAEQLDGLTSRLTFNRLAQVGSGAALEAPSKGELVRFLRDYLHARRHNPLLGVKDNLFNLIRAHFGRAHFGGCTGYGCGAAFNFLALLPDGEVHACRKLPSFLGRVNESSLADIYDSPVARRFRRGPEACQGCSLLNVCRGCPAVTHGQGGDPLVDRDPHCFREECGDVLSGF